MIGVRMVGACEMPEPDGSESKGADSRRAESRGTDSESAWSGCPEYEPWHGSIKSLEFQKVYKNHRKIK